MSLGRGLLLILSFVVMLSTNAPPAQADSIRDYCKGIVGDSYSLMEACIRGEEQARLNLQSGSTDRKIEAYCKKIVGGSYKLMEACIRREEQSRANIQSRPTASQADDNDSMVGEKGKLVSLLADYADFRQRVQDVRDTRKSGYASDTTDLIDLAKGIQKSMVVADNFRNAVHVVGVKENKSEVIASNLLYAYGAMSQIIRAEIDRNLFLQKSDIPLRIAEKHEEIWKMIDPSIPVVSVP
ncbi:MAG: hypothetical protein HP491_08195 [Nitrospira sp.]|nr:hypothetical protein [Nitrospira sp.]MBH0183156.1 hypothetical protein [Nitrospira sp.]MBH0186112.1 hypothetical protein [Nitrospira sp.]